MSRRAERLTAASFANAADAFRSLERELEKTTDRGLREVGEEIMTDVKASRQGKGVPVDTGALRSSGTVEGPGKQGEVVLGFGGPAAPYALYQHEVVGLSHTVGEARYLVRGVERWRADGSAAFRALQRNATEAVLRAGTITAGGGFPSAPFL